MEGLDSFGEWLRQRRTVLGLTRAELAAGAGCSVSALRKIEADERRPSRQLAELLAGCLRINPEDHAPFLDAARGVRRVERLGAPVPHAMRRPAPLPPLPAPVWRLPAPATPLIGREAELAILAHLLSNTSCRLLTLVGPGGIGKTRLALEAACLQWDAFADGVFMAPLAATSSHEFMASAIAQALGLTFSGPAPPRNQLVNYLSHQQALLLLDNLEHLLEGVDLIAEMLEKAPGLKLLATSRERLGLQREWVFEVQGLPVPAEGHMEELARYSGVQLFLQRARQAAVDFECALVDWPHVGRICRSVEGMPLAIELAAAWVPVLSCREIADEIERGMDILTTPLRDVPERQRSLRAVFDHSWRLLAEEERRMLRRLSVFRGGFTRQAALAVAGAELPALSALVSKSFLRRTSMGRFTMHELVRQYAASQLAEEPKEAVTARDRHCEFYLTLLHDREGALKSAAQQETIEQLTEEIDDVRAAWSRAVEREKFALLGSALRCFGLLFDICGWSREGIEQAELIMQALRAGPTNEERQTVLGQTLAQQGLFFFRLGDHLQAQSRFEEGLALLRPIGEPALLVDPLVLWGIIMHLNGQIARAHALLTEGLAQAQTAGDQWYAAYALFNLGGIDGLTGRFEEGYQKMLAAIALWRMLGDPRITALGLNFISPVAISMGRVVEAQAYLHESLALSTEVGDRWGIGTAYRYLGVAAMAQGDIPEAQSLIHRSLDIFKGFVIGWDVVRSLVYLGEAKAAANDLSAAKDCFLDALELAMEAGTIPLALDALVGLADLYARVGEAEHALALCFAVLSHPSGLYEARERANRLRAQAEKQLHPQQIVAAKARGLDLPLEATVQALLLSPPLPVPPPSSTSDES